MRDKKKIVIGLLCTLVCIMAVGYAVLAQQLNINGTASIDSTWKVEITNIGLSGVVGDVTIKETPSYTSTTANFSVGLTQPGDAIEYDIEISNLGTLAAKVDSINIAMDVNDAIKYTTTGVQAGDKLGVGEKDTLAIRVEYDSSVTSQPSVTTSDITVTVNYVQDLDEDSSTTYQSYSIGDVVTFAGSNWYVIENSSGGQDYVTLMKETVLTNDELGDYGFYETLTCSSSDVTSGIYGCTSEGEEVKVSYNKMSYYWSDTCHSYGYYGYTDTVTTGCSGHNDYEGSKVKEFLEGTYINTLSSDNLKEVDGYKIRLITMEELKNNLGWTSANDTTATYVGDEGNNVPTWVYQNFGDVGYWTMSLSSSSDVWIMDDFDDYLRVNPIYSSNAIRPVINLLKSSI